MSRLVDADALKKALCKVCGMRHYCKSHDDDCWAKRRIDEQPTVDAVPISRLRQILLDYFGIGKDCYTYELTRVKEAFEIGTMTFEDFVEWDEEQVEDLINHIICKMRKEQANATD